jgi:hypothetical protein
MRRYILISFSLLGTLMRAQTVPEPKRVLPGAQAFEHPSDAAVLFDGSSLNQWTKPDGSATGCVIDAEKAMSCTTGAKDAVSKETYRDAQIHLEYFLPAMPEQKGQHRGNSGVFLLNCYELQILDSLNNPTYSDGIAGALYRYRPPMVNASREARQWQSYDIFFTAPVCSESGEILQHAQATVVHNGVLVQLNTVMPGRGGGCRQQNLCAPGPLRLQDHSGFPNAPKTEMRFRNIWLRHL